MDKRIRIDFLDGVRGLSALYVVLYHAQLFTKSGVVLSENRLINFIQRIVSVGDISVAVFIVLSGYCLAIPVVNNQLYLKGGFARYIKRRAKRIIAPYFVAIILSLLIISLFRVLQTPHGTNWDSKIPITPMSIVSHFLLIHNLNNNWIYKINGAHWSVATEWQIYFLFPIMLWCWRKYGLFITLFVTCLLSVGLYVIVPIAHPQYIILFFMGAVSAYYSLGKPIVAYSNLFLVVTMLGFLVCLAVFIIHPFSILIFELIGGAFVSAFIYFVVVAKRNENVLKADRFLSSLIPMQLGKISYSIYLIHGPLLALANLLLLDHNFTYDHQLLLMWCVFVPIVVGMGYIYWWICERHFLNK